MNEYDSVTPPDQGFVDVLASGVHDTKNTLFDALGRIESVKRHLEQEATPDSTAIALLNEASNAVERSANRLAKILSAYRLLRHENPVVLLPTPLSDLAEYVRLRASEGWQGSATLEVNPAPDAVWLMDRELIADCLVNALTNASRYAKQKVSLDFRPEADCLFITVTDDGDGFPASILHGQVPFSSVGLFIAEKLASQHEMNGRKGRLTLSNRHDDVTGAVFSLMLP